MKEQKTWLCVVSIMIATQLAAQTKPEKIEGMIIAERDTAWYAVQTEAWHNVVLQNPTNEEAWRNYFAAAQYKERNATKNSLPHQVLVEMQQAIPDTYTFNFCAFRGVKMGFGLSDDMITYAEAALANLPNEMQFADYDTWVCYFAMRGDDARKAEMAKRYFESGIYSENVLRYSYNEMQGMADGGIYIGNGDATIIPKWLIQEGMNVHGDKTIICLSFLLLEEYRNWLFKKLDIPMPSLKPITKMSDYLDNEHTLVQAIIDKYGNKVYFSTLMQSNNIEPWKENLYNEGLLLKYSKNSYDNLAVKRHNVEDKYLLEYLKVSFHPDWIVGQRLNANYAVLLADLLPYYHEKNDTKHYTWLKSLLLNGVTNTTLSEEHKQNILNLLLK